MKPPTTAPITLVCLAFGLLVFLSLNTQTAQAQQIQVTAADPSAAAQGTINLNVNVTGKGFKNGARAKWFITGTSDPGGVQVNSTIFVNSVELTANITVSDTAIIANFDIQVLNSDGRGGKGTELFAVTAKGSGGGCTNLALSPSSSTTEYITLSPVWSFPVASDATCSPASIVSGSLDTCFGGTGIVASSISPPNWAVEVQMQADGKSVVALHGANPSGSGSDFYAVRYDSDGNLDTTFGTGGLVRIQFTSCADAEHIAAVALQSDGKILLAGSAYIKSNTYGFAVARLNPDGSLDSSFGNGGRVFFGFSSSAVLRAMVLQPDSRIVLVGSQSSDFAVARINANGTLDNTFGTGGKVVVQTVKSNTDGVGGANAVTLQSINNEERIVVGGGRPSTSRLSRDFAIMRFTPSGALDTSFGSGGQVFTDFYGYMDRVDELVIVGNSIVAGGMARRSTATEGADFGLVKYRVDGQLDSTFGIGGKVVTDILGTQNYIEGMAIQPDGKIVAAGAASPDIFTGDFALVRYNPDGSLDTSFGPGGNGVVLTDFSSRDGGTGGVALQADGRIVIAGSAGTSSNTTYVVLARYMP
jgi:uncharacterized delta-60 repeat protein